jgi:amino acid adenylation domain-containing protein
VHPLSYGQQALWFLHQQAPESTAYNIVRAARVYTAIHRPALRSAFQKLVQRHAALRTTFTTVAGQAVQQIHDHMEVGFVEEDASTWSRAFLQYRLREEACCPFDLEHGPLLRVRLYTQSTHEHILLLAMHHIAVDFWSLAVLMHELGVLYQSAVSDTEALLSPLTQQYTDCVRWQADLLTRPTGERLWAYWQQQLAGELPVLQLPTDRPRPPVQTYHGASHTLRLGATLTQQLKALSQVQGITLYTTLLTAFYILLHRYSGQEDLLVGSPMAGRSSAAWARLVGYLVNPVALRVNLAGDPTFAALLARVRQTVLGAFEHQDYPFALLVERLRVPHDASRSPLFQVMFVLQKAHRLDEQDLTPFALGEKGFQLDVGGLHLESMAIEQPAALFDLTLTMAEANGELYASMQYNTALFDMATITRLLGHFQTLLEGIVADPQQRIATLPLLTEAEQHQVLVTWNNTRAAYPQEQCLHQFFEAQVERTPDAIAVVCEAERLTYRELNQRANRLAHYLRRCGVGPDVLVGICVERSLDMVVGLLGILKAGGAYVPLDPEYPQARLAFMLSDAQVPVLLTQEHLIPALPAHAACVICLDAAWAGMAEEDVENPVHHVTPAHLAYVMYTSGSTGKPKGVMIPHRGICNRILWMQETYRLSATDCVLQKTPFSFDVSVWEFFWPLLTGARLVVARPGGHRDSAYLVALIAAEQITTLHFVPSMLQAFLEEQGLAACRSLRQVLCSGEALSCELQERFYARLEAALHNLYGPTEASVDVTFWSCQPASTRRTVPIGHPIANTQIYILDAHLQPVPVGVSGELHIGGIGLARGYLNRPELTAEKFIPDPFSHTPGARLYKTGDLARYQPDGSIEFLGRRDQQVKLRGLRLELGEIEAALELHPAVREAIVVCREDTTGTPRLVAYLVPAQGQTPTVGAWGSFLQTSLPEYMVPSAFVLLDALPLTPNGKVDRRALPPPEEARLTAANVYVAPRTPAEAVLVDIWQKVLGIVRVGIDDNFFALGGDSLRSLQVQARAREHGVHFSLQDLYQCQTIRALTHLSRPLETLPAAMSQTHAFALTPAADRHRLPDAVQDAYPLTRLQAEMLAYNQQHPNLAIYHDVFSYHFRAPLEGSALQAAVEQLATRHAILRTSFDLHNFSEPLQLVHHTALLPCAIEDWRPLSPGQQETALTAWITAEKQRHFDITRPPLLRFHLHRRTAETFQFTLSFHHAILDGWSVASMLTELFESYMALVGEQAVLSLCPPTSTFRDFVAHERHALASEACQRFWQQPCPDTASTMLPRCPAADTHPETPQSADLEVAISSRVCAGLQQLARTASVPLKSVLLAAHLKVISLLSGNADVCTGLVSHGRLEAPDAERVLGLFLNVLPYRLRLPETSWTALVRETFAGEQELLPVRHYPVAYGRKPAGHQPQFDTVCNFAHFRVYQRLQSLPHFEYLGGVFSDPFPYTLKANFILDPFSSALSLTLNYNRHLLCDAQIQAIGCCYASVLSAMAHEAGSDSQAQEASRGLGQNTLPTAYIVPLCFHQSEEQSAGIELRLVAE